jgi:FKBP-type peptidyl-prolyl cis-trans isomerase FkpA
MRQEEEAVCLWKARLKNLWTFYLVTVNHSSVSNLFSVVKKTSLQYILYILFVSCNSQPAQKKPELKDEELLKINKHNVNEEQEQIQDYIQRYNYSMTETKTGLHYMNIKEGNGKQLTVNTEVELKYRIQFLDGTYCYSSDSSGTLQLKIGQSPEPTGLQEGLLHMKEGGKALMIIPSYLAYGVTGDGNKIGSNQSLVYTVEVIKAENN